MKKVYVMKMAKRALRVLPVIFLSMAGMLALFFFCLTAFRLKGRVKVGVTAPQEDKMVAALITYVEHMNEISSLCEFKTVNENEGKEKLEQGEISALIVIPEGILNHIYRNRDISIRVYLPKTPTLESGLLREFSGACASLVLSAKSGDYTAYELYRRYRSAGDKMQVVRDMNGAYIQFAMGQGKVFENKAVPGEDGMSDGDRLLVSGLICLILLMGVPAAGLVKRNPEILERQLQRKGIGRMFQQGVCLFLLTGCLYVVGAGALAVTFLYKNFSLGLAASMFCLLPVCFFAASFFYFLYSCSSKPSGAVPMAFIAAVLLVFLPGGIYPPYMLPQGVVRLGQVLPGGLMIKSFWQSIWENRIGLENLWIFLYGIFFFFISLWVRRRGGRRKVC